MNFVVIVPQQLQEETLLAVITSFILREGTDYGSNEVQLETKQAQIKKQIAKEQIKIVFDPSTESLTLLTLQDFKKLNI
ncbi:MAG: YheU family protein [Bdellovibrionota bacterium]